MRIAELISRLTSCLLAFRYQIKAERMGYWMVMKSPFVEGEDWICGFTPHGMSGWNGIPDHLGKGGTPLEAAKSAFEALEAGKLSEAEFMSNLGIKDGSNER